MDENKAIDSANVAAIENLFGVFSTSFLMAKGDPNEEKKAEAAFKQGIEFNRIVYKRAKELIK
jgi:hypothetical protein